MNRKITLWLGNEDGNEIYHYEINREDSMISVGYAGKPGESDWQIFILPDLFPKIRAVMDAIEARQQKEPR